MADSQQNHEAGSLNQDEAILILEQADLAAQARLPLAPGLRALAEESSSNRVRRALYSLADRLERGEPMIEVLATLQPRLPPLISVLIEQGAELGRIDSVLQWAAEQTRRTFSLRSQLWCALTYPLVLLGVAGTIGLFIAMWILPMFKKIFEDFGTELPGLTVIMMSTVMFLSSHWVAIVGIGGPLLVIGIVLLINSGNWLVTQKWSVAIPVAGPLFRLSALSDFCSLMAVFVEIRLPLHKAVLLAGKACGNEWLNQACEEMAREIEAGTLTSSSVMELGLPIAIGQMIRSARSPEALAEALRGMGDMYAARAEVNSRAVGVIAEPFILLGTTATLGMVTIALFMPLIKLLNDLS